MSASARKPAPPVWTEADRIGRMSSAQLREMRLRALLSDEVSADDFIHVVEALEDILDTAENLATEPGMVVEEIVDGLKTIDREREDAVKEQTEKEDEWQKERDELDSQKKTAEDEHADVVRDHCATIDDLRKRAESAEHDLAEMQRATRGSDIDARDVLEQRVVLLEAQVAGRDAMIASLTKALTHARAENPIRTRKRKTS